jgi:hypothetical protein
MWIILDIEELRRINRAINEFVDTPTNHYERSKGTFCHVFSDNFVVLAVDSGEMIKG